MNQPSALSPADIPSASGSQAEVRAPVKLRVTCRDTWPLLMHDERLAPPHLAGARVLASGAAVVLVLSVTGRAALAWSWLRCRIEVLWPGGRPAAVGGLAGTWPRLDVIS